MDPEAAVTRARRVLLALDDEAALGSTAEVLAEEVALADGRRKRVRWLRLGRIAAFLATDDAAEAGALVRGAQGGYSLTQDARRAPLTAVLDAIEMADRHRTPAPLVLPIDAKTPGAGGTP